MEEGFKSERILVRKRNSFGMRRIELQVRKLSYAEMGRGLMFRPRETENLLFDFGKPVRRAIHSFFVFFPFLALWLDSSDNLIEWKIVKPFRFSVRPSQRFRKLIEIPFNKRNRKIVGFIVGSSENKV